MATPTVNRPFERLLTLWFQVTLEPASTEAPPAPGPTASKDTEVGGGPEATTESDTVVECVSAPLTPVIVNVDGPVGVDAAVVTANVDDPVAGFGVKVPVAPAGRPVT